MKTRSCLIAAAAAATLTGPAHAQVLGGGGLGGMTGGFGHTVNGTLGGSLGASANKSIDRRSGRASAGASADGMLGGTLDGVTSATGPRGNGVAASKSVRAEKRVSKSAAVHADGPGTDDGRNLVGGLTGTARGMAGGAAGATNGAAGSANGSASGSSSAASNGGLRGGSGTLMGSAGGSASGDGTLDVGTPVRDAKGRAVGRIEAIREETQTVLVSVGNRTAELPAGSLSANGEFATAAMSRAEIRKMAEADEPSAQP